MEILIKDGEKTIVHLLDGDITGITKTYPKSKITKALNIVSGFVNNVIQEDEMMCAASQSTVKGNDITYRTAGINMFSSTPHTTSFTTDPKLVEE